ncbi:MAG: hypothetical protein JWM44_1083 [Bacilli bacterium]|jgi:hypothetical protein|nr:hypothetical protein [Bacilli bacterium]
MLERMSLIFICIISSVILLSACSKNESSVNTTIASIKQLTQTATSTPIKKYISQDDALDVAKKLDPNADIKWDAKMIENKEVESNNIKKIITVWDVTAIYPAGNKMIVEIDAISGEQVSLTEIEATHWEVISRANLILGTVEELDMSGNILIGIKLKAEKYIIGTSPSDGSPIELGKSIYLKVNKAELKDSQKSYLIIGNQVILLVAQYIIGKENWFWGTGVERFFYKKNNDFYDSVDNSKFPFEVPPASHIGVDNKSE